jgi:hypothetical protein
MGRARRCGGAGARVRPVYRRLVLVVSVPRGRR